MVPDSRVASRLWSWPRWRRRCRPPAGAAGHPSRSTEPAPNTGIVDIFTTLDGDGAAAGTGMILTRSGEVLTNNHVIRGVTTSASST